MPQQRNIPSDSSTVASDVTRRQALTIGLGGLVAAAGLVAFGPRAFALTLGEADAPVARAFHAACGGVSYHDELASEVRKLLQAKGDRALPPQVDCPVCGCRVAVAAPDGK